MKIRVSISVVGVEMMFEFFVCRGFGVSLNKHNVSVDVEVSCRRLE